MFFFPLLLDKITFGFVMGLVPDKQEPEYSRGRLSEALGSWGAGSLEGRGGLGEGWGKWGQFTSNLRPRWTIPVTARRVPSK